jgi:hypothetical protein
MKPYALFVAYDVFDFMSRQSRLEQLQLRDRMLRIRELPGNYSDYLEIDSAGRPFHISVKGKHAIKYWIDEADRQIKIMEIRSSDRG